MIVSVVDQALLLLAAVYGGLILGLCFDIYRFIRRKAGFGRIITYMGDIIFWIISSGIILAVVYKSSSGLLRAYQLTGFALGMLVYIRVLSSHVTGLMHILFRSITRMSYTALKMVGMPFIIIYRVLWRPYNIIKKKMHAMFCRALKDTGKYFTILKNKK